MLEQWGAVVTRRNLILILALVGTASLCAWLWIFSQSKLPQELETRSEKQIERPNYQAADLKQTSILPSLESTIPENHNAIWTATLSLAWTELVKQAGEPVVFQHSSDESAELLKKLNGTSLPENCLADGDKELRVTQAIPGLLIESTMRLFVPFKFEFFEVSKPIQFTSGDGTSTGVSMFGVREEEMYNTSTFRTQAVLLWDDFKYNGQFAVDLCQYTQPYQVVLARIPRPRTLHDAIEYHRSKLAKSTGHLSLHDEDMLHVPQMGFRFKQSFPQLSNTISNGKFQGLELEADSDIQWTLNKSGASVIASSRIAVLNGGPRLLSFNEPFLILVVNRSTDSVVLAIWVDNSEVLMPYQE